MLLIIGLGNPGREYASTRHNMGFMALDAISDKLNTTISKSARKGLIGEGTINGKKVVLVKPQTFMNNSGWCVMEMCNWYKCSHNEILVIYDDVDLEAGEIRIREGGSSGTHNGMRSIIYQLGFDDFPRIRIGIGANADSDVKRELISLVLSEPSESEKELLKKAIYDAADAALMIAQGDISGAQAKYNKKGKAKKKAKAAQDAALDTSTDTEVKENTSSN